MLLLFLEFCEGLFGVFGLFPVGVEFEVGLVLGDGLVFFLHLLRDLGEGKVGCRVIGLDLDGIFRAEVGALVVFIPHVELCYVEIFVDALVVALDMLGFGKFAMDGGAFGRIVALEGWIVGVSWVGVVAAA